MNLLNTIRKTCWNRMVKTMTAIQRTRSPWTKTCTPWRTLATAAVLSLAAVSHVSAQTAPAYVVYSQTPLSGTGSANPNVSFGGFRGHVAFNSRGDFFVSDGGGQHVYKYPANGGSASLIWTDTNGNQFAGTAVDPTDNLFISDFTYNGPSGTNDQNSLLYQFPFTNGSYPGAYVFSQSSPPGACNPAVAATSTTPAVLANTGVCSVGFFQGAIYYYWQGPFDIAVDGQGTNYTISGYTSHDNGTALTIYQCQLACAQQIPGNGASAYTGVLPRSVLSIAANFPGDLYLADNVNVSLIPAGSPTSSNTPAVFDATYTQPYGVSFDPSGNLYVADAVGFWEVPARESGGAPCKGGADKCTLTASSKYLLIPFPYSGSAALYTSYLAPSFDNRGNFIATPNYGTLNKYSLFQGNFPPAQIGATGSTSVNFTVAFNKATTVSSFSAVQGSGPATEFAVSPGSCTPGAFPAGSSCNFSATFTPSGLGVRTGAVVITDSTGKSTYTYLTGNGTGTGITVDPGTPTQIGTGFKTPMGVAVDQAGNVYIADSSANKVQEYPAGSATAVSIGTGLNVPTGVAVDGSGNVYIVNQGTGATGGTVVEVPNIAGVITNSAQKTLVSGLNLPTDIIVDGDGNLYISATGSNQVLQLASINLDSASAATVSVGLGLSSPTGLALDSSGNVYVADTGNNRVLQLGDGFQNTVGSGLTTPTGVTTDPSGSVIIADGTGRLIRVPNESYGTNAVGLNAADQQVLSSPLSYPYSLRTDSTGNLYVSDNVAAVVYQLQRTTGAINFGNWNVNTVSDAQSIVFSNSGTADVTIGNPPFPAVPTASEFVVNSGSGSSACGGGVFHSGFNCTVQAMFDPTTTGPVNYPLVFAATAQNTAAPTVKLSGTGVNQAAATLKLIQVAPATTTITYGQQIIISAKVSPSGSTATPTGYIVFNFDGQNQRPIKLDATGAASITFNGLNAGSNTLSAYYEGDTNYASLNSAVLPLNIQQATETNVLTVIGDSAVPLSVQPTNTLNLTAVLTPSVAGAFGGTVNFVDVATNMPLNTDSSGNVVPIRIGSPDPKTGVYTVSFSFQPQSKFSSTTFPANFSVVAVYSGNIDYVPASSAAIPYTVSKTTYTVTVDKTSVTSTASTPGLINVTVTDYSNFRGNVSLQCTGLPANAYCVFRPASAQLIPAAGPLPNTSLVPNTIYPVPIALKILVDQNIIPIQGSVFWFSALLLGFALAWRKKIKTGSLGIGSLAMVLCMAGLVSLGGCSSGVNNPYPTPPGTYAVTITASATPLQADGSEPPCSYTNCNLPPDPVTNPSIIVTKTVPITVTIQ